MNHADGPEDQVQRAGRDNAACWISFFPVTEIRARSTPQLVAIGGTMAGLAITVPWVTIARIHRRDAFDWFIVPLLIVPSILVTVPAAARSFARRARGETDE